MIDSIAGVVFGAFLLAVVVQGKSPQLIELAKRDKQFLQWAIAVGILVYLHKIPELAGPVKWLIILGFVGLGLTSAGKIKDNAEKFWQQIGA